MIAGLAMRDEHVLNIGAAIESLLAADGRAIHGAHSGSHSTTVA